MAATVALLIVNVLFGGLNTAIGLRGKSPFNLASGAFSLIVAMVLVAEIIARIVQGGAS